jgi:hypothetical protein
LDPNSEPELITDPDPKLQIILNLSGSTTLQFFLFINNILASWTRNNLVGDYSVLVASPRRRMQLGQFHGGMVHAVRQTYRQNGVVKGLYR